MADNNDLKRLSKIELLELLVNQAKEIERLRNALEETEKKLEDKRIRINKTGSLAEASLALNGVFEAAQAAAEQYVNNVKLSVSESMKSGMLAKGRTDEQQAAQIIADAKAKAKEIIAEANENAQLTETEAKLRADQYWNNLSIKLENFYRSHPGLKDYLRDRDKKKDAQDDWEF